jgi:ribosome maturation factor RimP
MEGDRVASLWKSIEPILEPEGMELVELECKPERGRLVLRLYIDRPGGITLDDCEMVSRQVGAFLDMEDPFNRPYTLEVSSPGINRVLRKEKDFNLYAGAPVRIRTRRKIGGRRNFSGIIEGARDARILIRIGDELVEIGADDLEKAHLDLPEADLFRRTMPKEAATVGD